MPKVGMEPLRKAALINAALECICERGLDSTTMEAVAAQAGCSKGVAAYYFKSKKQLMLESMQAFLAYYQRKIAGDIQQGMSPEDMLDVVLCHSLPPLDEPGGDPRIQVSDLEGLASMNIPPEKKARLFMQFFSRAMQDEDMQAVIRQVYPRDIAGIGEIMAYGKAVGRYEPGDPEQAAYGLLAMVVGLSMFRVLGVFPQGTADNRSICTNYLQRMVMKPQRRNGNGEQVQSGDRVERRE